jgi:hypothetical protein
MRTGKKKHGGAHPAQPHFVVVKSSPKGKILVDVGPLKDLFIQVMEDLDVGILNEELKKIAAFIASPPLEAGTPLLTYDQYRARVFILDTWTEFFSNITLRGNRICIHERRAS